MEWGTSQKKVDLDKKTIDLAQAVQYFRGLYGRFRQHPGQDIVKLPQPLLNRRQLFSNGISGKMPLLTDKAGCVARAFQDEQIVKRTFTEKRDNLDVDEAIISGPPYKADPENLLLALLTKSRTIKAA